MTEGTTAENLSGVINFLKASERLKDTRRSGVTTSGRPESTAEHTWRLCLFVMALEDRPPDADIGKLSRMCVIHDLGEAIGGDIPAIDQDPSRPKSESERRDFQTPISPLPDSLQARFLALWDEYDAGLSREAELAKGLDKLETIMQHNQGAETGAIDHVFNLNYGRERTDAVPLLAAVRRILDRDTERRVRGLPTSEAPLD